jgi:hypothetical protein
MPSVDKSKIHLDTLGNKRWKRQIGRGIVKFDYRLVAGFFQVFKPYSFERDVRVGRMQLMWVNHDVTWAQELGESLADEER